MGTLRKRQTAREVFGLLERHLPRLIKNQKLSVKVIYQNGMDNESLDSQDLIYLCYVTSCFMEDFLTETTMNRILKKWTAGQQ